MASRNMFPACVLLGFLSMDCQYAEDYNFQGTTLFDATRVLKYKSKELKVCRPTAGHPLSNRIKDWSAEIARNSKNVIYPNKFQPRPVAPL